MKKYIPNPILRGAMIAGMLVIVVFAVIGITKIVPKAITSIGSAFSSISSSLLSPKETIVLSLSKNSIKTGEEVSVSFVHKNKTKAGVYEFKFDCADKDISMVLIDAGKQKNILCTATSTLSSNTFKIVPALKNTNSFVDSYIHVTFYDTEKNKQVATGKTVLTIYNGDTKGITSKPSDTSITQQTKIVLDSSVQNIKQEVANANGINKSDLYIITKDAGIVVNSVFITKTNFSSYESPSVRFDIGNDGNVPTGPWQFTAILPTYPSQIFPSGVQPSLAPGEIIEYTLSLKNLASTGNNIVSINVDPSQNVSELSETNNTTAITLINSGVGYNVNSAQNYNTGYYSSSNSDLMVRVISKGYIERNTGRYYVANSVSENNRTAIRFEIENIGTGETGPFIFTADLSGYSNDQYTSPTQTSFYPGEKRQYTVDFNSGVSNLGTNKITIRLDTNNNVNETRKDNNVLSQDILVY